jgi:hypothetical protein
MLLGQLFLAEERGRERLTALFCDKDSAGEMWVGTTGSEVYIITVRKGHVDGAGGRQIRWTIEAKG